MLRLGLIELILFLTPFALYFAYRSFVQRREIETHGRFNERATHLLVIAGGVLALGGLVVFAVTSGMRGDTVYIPAHVENGEVVRGAFVPRGDAGELARMNPRERANPEPDAPTQPPSPTAPLPTSR